MSSRGESRTRQNSNSPAAATSGWLDRICSVRVVPERGIPTIRIGVASSTPGVLAIAEAGRCSLNQPVDATGERGAVEAAASGAKAVAGLEVLHRRFIVADVVIRLPQGEMKRPALARRRMRPLQGAFHPRDPGSVLVAELPVGREA